MSESIDRGDAATMDAIEGLVTGTMRRDDFIKRLTYLGFTAGAIGGMLAAADKAGAGVDRLYSQARPFAGETIRILVVAEGDDKGVRDKIATIKKRFGIDLKMTALPVGPLLEKANQNLKAPTSSFEIIQVLGFSVSQMVGGGFFEPLNKYLSKAPAGYDFKDFPPGQLKYTGYYDTKKQQFGGKTLYLIPGLHAGSVILFYRKDLFKEARVQAPRTWSGYLAIAGRLHRDGVAGNSMVAKSGDVSMFLVDWYTRFANMGGKLTTGSPQAKTLRPQLTSPQAVGALQHMVDCVEFASDGVLSYDFTLSLDAFSAGRTAMMLMWSTIGGPVYNPKSSKVAGKVGVALPVGPGKAVRGGWGVGIPKNAKNKEAAWQVITYLTSKEWDRYQSGTYQTDPTRRSTFKALAKRFPHLTVAGQEIERAQILEIASVPETFEMITAAAEEFSAALNGSSSASAACKQANDRWTSILKRGGHLR